MPKLQRVTLCLLSASLLLAGCSKLTIENYDKLETGMAYEQVVSILGTPAGCDEVLGIKNCRWGDASRSINISFASGKVLFTSAENIR